MKCLIIALLASFSVVALAEYRCSTTTVITTDNRVITCTTCCYLGNCTTTCI